MVLRNKTSHVSLFGRLDSLDFYTSATRDFITQSLGQALRVSPGQTRGLPVSELSSTERLHKHLGIALIVVEVLARDR